jgi:hypothetical protein
MEEKKQYIVGDDESKKTESFLKKTESENKLLQYIKDGLISVTENEFKKLGYESIDPEKYQGVYAGKEAVKLGRGADENKFSVKLEGRTKNSIVKKTTFGAKRVESVVNIIYKDEHVDIQYKNTEAGFFRGVTNNEKKTFKISDKDGITSFFKECAKKEIAYLTGTKLGVEDKNEKSTASIVSEQKIDPKTIIAKKTIPLNQTDKGDKNSNLPKDKKLFFDNKVMKNEKTDSGNKKSTVKCKKCEHQFNMLAVKESTQGCVKCPKCGNSVTQKDEVMKEITATGPTGSGAGSFLTKNFLATNYAKNKLHKKPKIDRDYNVVKQNEWTTVKVDPNPHPQGMPFVKPNSKAEFKANTTGDKDKLKRMGLNENVSQQPISLKPHDPLKRKIFSESDNKKLGINKRYLITEKTSDEYLKERWKRLVDIKLNETIEKEIENLDDLDLPINSDPLDIDVNIKNDKPISISDVDPYFDRDDAELSEPDGVMMESHEETMEIQKPNSWFNTSYKFYKKDFLSENKYIMDLNSRVYVSNPRMLNEGNNSKSKK